MRLFAQLTVFVVAVLHVGFMALEMVFWTKPLGMEIFDTTPEFAAASADLAINQGFYNGFLAAGLLWGLLAGKRDVKVFFLGCVIVAGIVGGLTVSTTIIAVQAAPAALALLLTLVASQAKG
ncbi:MAG: DUF1304 domain-containing protein [Pseudomonadota bacterium]